MCVSPGPTVGLRRSLSNPVWIEKEDDTNMQPTSGFFIRRDLSQMTREELEDLDFHLSSRMQGLHTRIEQMTRDMEALKTDREQIGLLLSKR